MEKIWRLKIPKIKEKKKDWELLPPAKKRKTSKKQIVESLAIFGRW